MDNVTRFNNESGFSFSDDVIAKALNNIYKKECDVKKDIEPNIFKETFRIINEAADKGVAQSTVNTSDAFNNALRYNNAVYAAFRTHRMQNDIATQLLDDKGKLKPFAAFKADTEPLVSHHVNAWLQTEYDTAIRRAHLAADWQRFTSEKDVLPNLEWLPSTSITPGEDHRPFWGMIAPIDAPEWDMNRPGDRWGCKCGLRSTDKTPTPIPHGTENDKPSAGLENNPGKDAMLFAPTNPMQANAYPGAEKAVSGFIDELVAQKEIEDVDFDPEKEAKEKNIAKQKIVASRNEVKDWADKEIPKGKALNIKINDKYINKITLTRASVKTLVSKPHSDIIQRNNAVMNMKKLFNKADFYGWAEDEKINGIKKHPDVDYWMYYKSDEWYVCVKRTMDKLYKPYAIVDENDFTKIVGVKKESPIR